MAKIVYFEENENQKCIIRLVKGYRRGRWFLREKIWYSYSVVDGLPFVDEETIALVTTKVKKDYPKMVDVRPDNDTIVITKYNDDSHYEIVEYANRTWVTELDFPVKPSHWAYVPQKVVNLADSIIKQKQED